MYISTVLYPQHEGHDLSHLTEEVKKNGGHDLLTSAPAHCENSETSSRTKSDRDTGGLLQSYLPVIFHNDKCYKSKLLLHNHVSPQPDTAFMGIAGGHHHHQQPPQCCNRS